MPISWWMGKENVSPDNGISYSHKEKWNSDPRYSADESRKHQAEWQKLDTESHILWDSIYIWNVQNRPIHRDREQISGHQDLGAREKGGWALNGYGVSFWGDGNVLDFFLLLRCSPRGILVPRPGIEPGPPAVEAWSPNHWTAGEFPMFWK